MSVWELNACLFGLDKKGGNKQAEATSIDEMRALGFEV